MAMKTDSLLTGSAGAKSSRLSGLSIFNYMTGNMPLSCYADIAIINTQETEEQV